MADLGPVLVGSTSPQRIPQVPGYSTIVVLTRNFRSADDYDSVPELGPYELKTPEGHLVENRYQFSKVYEKTPEVTISVSSRDRRVAWEYPGTQFLSSEGKILPEYWEWRRRGMACELPVRNPVGWPAMKTCLYAVDGLFSLVDYEVDPNDLVRLGYVEARTEIYQRQYRRSAIKSPHFHQLLDRLIEGERLLIAEVDGPRPEAAAYYLRTYGLDVSQGWMAATPENLEVMRNDTLKPYGHGYVLGEMLRHSYESQ